MAGRLFVVKWSILDRWVIPSIWLLGAQLPKGWVRLKIGDIVRIIDDPERVDPEKTYRMAGVKWYGEGVFEREVVKGADLSSTYVYPLKPGALIYNRLFAWKGSFAVVPHELAGCYVSSEFPQFLPEPSRAIPEYLYLYCMSERVNAAVRAYSAGSAAVSRNRLREEFFLDIDLLLPPVDYQASVVARWRESRDLLDRCECATRPRRLAINKGFFAALGLVAPQAADLPKVFAVRWRDATRWSVSYNQQVQAGMDLSHGRYPVVTLGSILTMVQYGTSQKANSDGRGTPILRINNIKDGQIYTGDLKHLELTGRELDSLRLEDGDILIIRTSGSRDLVGTCAVFRGTDPFVFASYLIRLRVDQAQADSSYVAWVINSPIGRQQVNAISRQIMQNNINSEEIRSLEIPLPPLDVQRKIMAEVQAGLAEIAQLRESAKVQADAARAEVERMIIGTR